MKFAMGKPGIAASYAGTRFQHHPSLHVFKNVARHAEALTG